MVSSIIYPHCARSQCGQNILIFEKFMSTLTSLPKICQNDQTHAELSQTIEEYLQADLTHD